MPTGEHIPNDLEWPLTIISLIHFLHCGNISLSCKESRHTLSNMAGRLRKVLVKGGMARVT